jgi:hypothetical protein
MRKFLTFLKTILTVALFLGGLPVLACDASCPLASLSMACAQRCAVSPADRNNGGAQGLHEACCGGIFETETTPAILAAGPVLTSPATLPVDFFNTIAPLVVPSVVHFIDGPAPDVAGAYLGSYHPFSNAPPSLL